MKIVSAAEMREIDRITTEKFGVPSLTLMENAGRAVAECVPLMAQTILVVCGKGNNAGDGFVATRHLLEMGKKVVLVLLADPSTLTGDASVMFSRLQVRPHICTTVGQLAECLTANGRYDVVIDAIFGTGVNPPVTGIYANAIKAINDLHLPTISVDLPSGADGDATEILPDHVPVIHAHEIVTFTALKPAHVFAFGDIPTVVKQIGTPDEVVHSAARLHLVTREDVKSLFAPRRAESNKGSYGHALIVGGSVGKAGAPAMTGMAALRAGAGLVTVAVPQAILDTVAGFVPELMTEPLAQNDTGALSDGSLQRLQELAASRTVLAVGPGASLHPDTAAVLRTLVQNAGQSIVLDADGLNAFVGHTKLLNGSARALVLTPHPGELARLNDMSVQEIQRDRIAAARDFAVRSHAIVVLKGNRTIVADPEGNAWINPTGNPGMATAGTGDILTGLIAGLIAQFPDQVFNCVIAAVHLHGIAGNLAVQQTGEMPLVATDLLRFLPDAIRQVQAE